ncbi:MAG: flagellar export chaperone FliS [Phycisphaerales bacterium JB040]
MNDPKHANAYLQTKVMSATPEELRLMLLDGAIKFAIQGRDGLAARDFEQAYLGFSQCRPIVLELLNTIRDDQDPDLAGRVRGVYTFILSELIQGAHEKDVPRINKVIELLEYERETWVLLMRKLATEKKPGQSAPARSPEPSGEPKSRPAFSVQG